MNHATDILRVKQIVIDEEGNVAKRFPRIDAEGQLKNTLLFAIHPEICVLSCKYRAFLMRTSDQPRVLMRALRRPGVSCWRQRPAKDEARKTPLRPATTQMVPQHSPATVPLSWFDRRRIQEGAGRAQQEARKRAAKIHQLGKEFSENSPNR
jgi:hypothetical protein